MKIFSGTGILEKALNAAWARNEAISRNIANADTPGYKRDTVDFEDFLGEAIENKTLKGRITDPKHIPIGSSGTGNPEIVINKDNSSLSTRLDGNNVDIDNEMALMAKNSLIYNTLIQRLSGEFRKLRTAINEGRR